MDLDDAGRRVKYLIRDRDRKYPARFDQVLADAGITTVLSGVRMPRMNSIMERWIQSCRHELLDRTLIWNQAHLLHALREYERHHNDHRPHRASETRDPCSRCPNRSPIPRHSRVCASVDTIASADSSMNTIMRPDLRGQNFRHPQGCRSGRRWRCRGICTTPAAPANWASPPR